MHALLVPLCSLLSSLTFAANSVQACLHLHRAVHACSTGVAVQLGDATLKDPIRALAFDSSGSFLLAGGDDKTARVWDLHSGRLMHSWCAGHRACSTGCQD